MANKSLFKLFLLIILACGLSGCEEDPYYDPYEEVTYDLCRTPWVDRYTTNDMRDCEQVLTFYPDFTGRDYRTYFYPSGATQTDDVPFYRHWDDGYTDALYIEYPDREGLWVEDIWFGYNTMNCLFDGFEVSFKAYY